MSSKERQRKFESYGSVYETLINDLKCFPREMRQFRPATDHRSIHDIIVHIANSEVESYILCGRLLAKFAFALPDYDDIKRIYDSGKHSQSIDEALASIKKLRLTTNSLIKTLPDVAWLPQWIPRSRMPSKWIVG